MPRIESLPLLVWAVAGFASWQSSALLHAWRHSPLDRLGWLAFAFWCVPAVAYLLPRDVPDPAPMRKPLLAGSLLATLGGTVGDVNAAHYLGLALAVAAIPGCSWRTMAWLGTSLSWMPALSWLAQGSPRSLLMGGRLFLALVGVAITLVPWRLPSRFSSSSLPGPHQPDPSPSI